MYVTLAHIHTHIHTHTRTYPPSQSKKEQERAAADAHLEKVAESKQASLERSFASFGR